MRVAGIVLATVLALAGCDMWFEPKPVSDANQLLREGKLEEALRTVDSFLKEEPDSLPAKRVRVWILLRGDRIDLAGTALASLPAGDPVIASALKHRDPHVRIGASKLVAERPAAAKLKAIAQSLDDPVPDVRRYCARALGKRGDRKAVRPLFQILQDDNWFVRAEAVSALGKLREPRAAGWLIFLLRDRDGFVRYSAMEALREVAAESNRDLLRRAMNQAPLPQQYFIAYALAKLEDPAAYPRLLDALRDDSAVVRARAAEALGEAGVADATSKLQSLLTDSDDEVRAQARQALRKLETAKKP